MDTCQRGHSESAHKRVEQVYRFTDRLYRAETPNDLYEAALDILICALNCSGASILLRDDTGTMRFTAGRGLSFADRGAVEGLSPWRLDVKEASPVCIQNIEKTQLPEISKKALKAGQIGALAFIPIVGDSGLIGTFITYYDADHVFGAGDMAPAVIIARQLGFSLERTRVEDALRVAQGQLEAELAATQHLQRTSTQLIHASDVEVLYETILDAAVAIMRSDFASMQMFYPERGELLLLAYRGFNQASAAFWEWVRPASACTCGIALASGQRSIVADIELSDVIAGSQDLQAYRENGIRAVQSTPLFSRAGRLLGMISTHWRNPHQPSERDLRLLDVLARQAADLIERRQTTVTDQRLAAIVDSSHDAIVSQDLNGLVTTWNRGAERLFGYPPGEIIGRSITILIPADRHFEEDQILERIRRGARVDPYETVRTRRDGTLVEVSVSASPLRNAAGEVIGASKIVRDITERKRAELVLAERNLQLALAGKAALVGSYAYDVNTDRLQVDEGYAALHGLPEGTVETTRTEWRARTLPEDVERVEGIRAQAFRKRLGEFDIEYRIARAGGRVQWIESRSFISYTSDGEPQRVVGVNIDITERKRAEDQQQKLTAELDHRVKNVLAAVSAIASHTKDASSSMDGFVAALDNRIRSMASTHELLSSRRWQGVPLEDLVRRELAPYATHKNIRINGPNVILSAEAAQATASVLHELTTNAAKYGALSTGNGQVSVCWSRATNCKKPAPLFIEWLETGGPRMGAQSASGYGRRVITELVPYELGGTACLLFPPEGVRCRLAIPGKWLAPAGDTDLTNTAADVSDHTIASGARARG